MVLLSTLNFQDIDSESKVSNNVQKQPPEGMWNSRVKKPSYGLWRHKTELSQIVTSKLIFRNSETLQWKIENKKAELSNSNILFHEKFLSYLTRGLFKRFPSYVTQEFYYTSPKPYRHSKTFVWNGLKNKSIHHLRDFKDAFLKHGF